MKRKLLALILTLVMVLTLFAGCGKKDSTYFKEVKEISQVTKGKVTAELNFDYYDKEMTDFPELVKNSEGKVSASIKIESITESESKLGAKIYVKLGQDTEYAELTTIAVVDKKLYLTVTPVIELMKKIDATTASQVEAALGQMGIAGSISVDLDKVLEIVGTEYPEVTDDNKKAALDLLNGLFDALENNFKDLEGQDGDAYTLTLNNENAEKAVAGLVNFLKNDAEGLINQFTEFMKNVSGDDATVSGMLSSYEEMINELPQAATTVEENKDEFIKAVKDYNIKVTSSAQVSGDKGKRVGKITLDTGNIKVDGNEISLKCTSEVREGEGSVDEILPKDASDITTLLVTMFNQMGAVDDDMAIDDDMFVDDMTVDDDMFVDDMNVDVY